MKERNTEIEVECRLCKAKYTIKHEDFVFAVKHNDGWFPCSICGSRATKWSLEDCNG